MPLSDRGISMSLAGGVDKRNSSLTGPTPIGCGEVRLTFAGELLTFVMLSEAKHLGREGNQRLFLCLAQILRWRSSLP